MTDKRAPREGTWVVHTRAEDWRAMELGTVQTLPSGIRGATYHHIPQGLPGIFLGRLATKRARGTKPRQNPLVKVLWMGKVFMCGMDDIMRAP